jgi:hypothetical protein
MASGNTGSLTEEEVFNFIRRIDVSEAVDIERYLDKAESIRNDVHNHYAFMHRMKEFSDMPIQPWEFTVSSRLKLSL